MEIKAIRTDADDLAALREGLHSPAEVRVRESEPVAAWARGVVIDGLILANGSDVP